MIRVIFFDLGSTLVDDQNRPFPHVRDAIETIQDFTTTTGKPIATALVSDFTMASPPPTAAKIKTIFDEYLAILDTTGLRAFFEPVTRRVTLSTHAGAFKPDRKVFKTALTRLHSTAALKECLFITENGGHVKAARQTLHMTALRFRAPGSKTFDFDDWLQTPALVAHLLNPAGGANADAAIARHLAVAHGFEAASIDRPKGRGKALRVRGTLWHPVEDAARGSAGPLHAPFHVEGEITQGPAGEVRRVRLNGPTPNETAEAASFARSLTRHAQVRGTRSPLGTAPTHEIEVDAQGRRRLVRKRFSVL